MSIIIEESPAARLQQSSATKPDWQAVARALAQEFRQTFVEREGGKVRPLAEVQRFRDTGLVNLLIPSELGGEGGTLGDAARAVLEISKADGSLGFLLSFHYSNQSTPRTLDQAGRGVRFERLSAVNRWFWGNVIGPFHISAEPQPDGGFIVSGTKHMCTGASLADAIKIMGKHADRDEMLHFVVPTTRAGIEFHDDWDHLGLRSTETHTVTLHRVRVQPEEVVPSPQPSGGFAPFAGASLFTAAFYLGSLTGAMEAAREYMRRTPSNPRPLGGNFESPTEDPFIQLEYGEAWIKLQALEALFERQIRDAENAHERRGTILPGELAEIGRRGTALQIFASRVTLDFTAKVFELTGGRSLARSLGLDRYWRDARAFSVHHPTSYMVKGLGEWALGNTPKRPDVFAVRRTHEQRRANTANQQPNSA